MPPARPVRPSLAPILWCGLALWGGSALGSELAWRACSSSDAWLAGGWAGAALCCAIAVAAARTRTLWPVALAAAVAVGLATALLHGAWLTASGSALDRAGPREWRGVVVSDPRTSLAGAMVEVRLDLRGSPQVSVPWPEGERAPEYGRTVRVWARFSRPAADDDWARIGYLDGEAASGRPWRVRTGEWVAGPLGAVCRWRARCLALLRGMDEPGAAVLAACLFGDRGALDGMEADEAFRAAGVAYLVGGSGLHVGLAVALAVWLARAAGAGPRTRAGVTVAGALVFALACAGRVSIVRAGLALAVSAVVGAAGRRRDVSAALGAAVALIVGVDPSAAFDLGLAIGVSALLGLLVLGPLAGEWCAAAFPRRVQALLRPVGASLGVHAGLTPVSAVMFGCVSPAAPVAACVVPLMQAPLCAALVGAGAAAADPRLGAAILLLAARALTPALSAIEALARLPGVSVPVEAPSAPVLVAWVAACAALWWRWPAPRRVARVRAGVAALSVVVLLSLAVPFGGGAVVTVLDVGQGDAVLVRDGARSMLVDCGPEPVAMRRALARAGVRTLDAVVLTHDHADHTGGIEALRGIGGIRWVGGPAPGMTGSASPLGAARPVVLRSGARWQVGSWAVSVAWPPTDAEGLEGNDTSVILLVERPGARILLLGDAEQTAQSGALRSLPGRVDALKVAHHGSSNGVVASALREWRPACAVISVGAGNRFGHPHRAALQALRETGARVWRTDLDGDVGLRATASGLRITTGKRRDARAACATIDRPERQSADVPPPATWRQPDRARRGPVGPQARLPRPWLRGAAARPRGPPPAGKAGLRSGPRLQHGDVRRRDRVG